ncbi:hypothetical protein [Blastochloris sulfoviridis]|uniref:Uncharacterized protein n=1 Tax=Blastochloris sulfoviridis TaxID=50712 RepID=A0A5M6HUH7_9HYPH|nr:hypothetical protein [Blastochloris sulfoviridis]KAA5599512.1 hypothetical protein F1193_12300 [Blastochloris sulfoviridis]
MAAELQQPGCGAAPHPDAQAGFAFVGPFGEVRGAVLGQLEGVADVGVGEHGTGGGHRFVPYWY